MELLAPAGSPEALRAAVVNGADAVYLGLEQFSARAGADNFTTGNLREWVRYAHLFGVKVYVAINTIIKQSEMDDALAAVSFAHQSYADAIIVQDLGLIAQIRQTMPDIVLHGSTQMGFHNLEGALCAEQLGLRRIVLARETPLSEIRRISKETSLELEYFVHGALCIGFSGNCYMSSYVSGLSGNRGRCLQLCRKSYKAACNSFHVDGYWLSPADLCLVDYLSELQAAGIDSFKIEGRLKRKEYVGETVRVYKKAMNGIELSDEDRESLGVLFNRGNFHSGYLDNKDVVFPYTPSHLGITIGTVKSVENNVAQLDVNREIHKGDGIKFIRGKFEVGTASCKGGCETTFVGDVRPNDWVNLTTSVALLDEINNRTRKIPISVIARLVRGQAVEFSAKADKITVTVAGDICETAQNTPIRKEDIERALLKGSADFDPTVSVLLDENLFVSQSSLNALRRTLYTRLSDSIIDAYEQSMNKNSSKKFKSIAHKRYTMSNIVYVIDEGNIDLNLDGNIIYNPKNYQNVSAYAKALEKFGEKLILNLPIYAEEKDLEILKHLLYDFDIKSVCANNLYAYSLAADKQIVSGYGLNLANTFGGGNFMQSAELDFILGKEYYVYTYGHFPLMTYKHCPRYTFRHDCSGCNGNYEMGLADDKGYFFVRPYKIANCYAQLMSLRPVCLLEEMKQRKHKRVVIDFTGIKPEQARRVLQGEYGGHTHFNFNKKLV